MPELLPNPTATDAPLLFDRRQHLRRRSHGDGTRVWTLDGRCIPVQLLDESENGLGFVVAEDQSFEFGHRIDVEHNGRRRLATLIHVARRSDGSYRLGLEWLAR